MDASSVSKETTRLQFTPGGVGRLRDAAGGLMHNASARDTGAGARGSSGVPLGIVAVT